MRQEKKSYDTSPLTLWAVALWLVVVVSLGVGTAFLLALSLELSEWVAVALGGLFTLGYSQLFWIVLRRVQRTAGTR